MQARKIAEWKQNKLREKQRERKKLIILIWAHSTN